MYWVPWCVSNKVFSDAQQTIRGERVLSRQTQSEIAVTEFKVLESRKT